MNDIINLQDRILAADINDPFDETNYIELFLEKESARENRRARKATAKVQAKRIKEIKKQFNLQKDVARSHNIKARNNNMEEALAVATNKQKNHLTYSHIDFSSDGCLNRIYNKTSKGEISGWKMPSKRSKTQNLAVMAQEALDELYQEETDMAEIEANAKLNEQKLKREAILANIDAQAEEILDNMRSEWEDFAILLTSSLLKIKESF